MFYLYSKKKVIDPVFSFRGSATTWEECMEKLELLAKDNDAISFVELDNVDLHSRTWEYDRTNRKIINK